MWNSSHIVSSTLVDTRERWACLTRLSVTSSSLLLDTRLRFRMFADIARFTNACYGRPTYTAGNYIFALWFLLSSSLSSRYVIGQTIIFSSCGFFFFPRLISAATDWMSTILRCGLSANLRCRSETCCTRLAEIQDAKKSPKTPSGHHRTTLSGYIFATKARIDNRKKT